MSMKRLKDKYFIAEDDGIHLNKDACKKDAQALAYDGIILTALVVGSLAAVGLAAIGVRTIRIGASTLREGATIAISHLRK